MQPIHTKNRVIGLLGGSFNPAHEGHLHISLYALNHLHMDEVWWLVSPKNPLKDEKSLAAYEERLASARRMAQDRRIRVLRIEAKIGARYSYQTISYLKRRYKGAHFVWIMGADNLALFHRWRRWQYILRELPVVVLDRAPYSHTALRSKTWQYMQRFHLKNIDLNIRQPAPLIGFFHLKRHVASATALRKKLGKAAFLRHNEK